MATINHGLNVLPLDDGRDFKFGAIYDLPKLEDLPPEFEVCGATNIVDQKKTDYCTAAASTKVSQDQEQVELDFLWQFMKGKQVSGDPHGFGCDLRSMGMSFVKYGSIEKSMNNIFDIDSPRSDIIDPAKWPEEFDVLAAIHKKASVMFITGPEDFFDNIRLTLWKNRADQKTIVTGAEWCLEWTKAPGGIVDFQGIPSAGHAFKIFGWKQIKGEPYLKAQLSNGNLIGDSGIFYFSRDIINLSKKFGAIIFTDLTRGEVDELLKNHQKVTTNPFVSVFRFFKSLWSRGSS